jgi:hypothetical protein
LSRQQTSAPIEDSLHHVIPLHKIPQWHPISLRVKCLYNYL